MLKKQFLKTKCKVTFVLPEDVAANVQTVYLVGDFNNWDEKATPMDKKGKSFQTTIDLQLEKDYQFRYLVDGQWHNDWHADRYVANPFSGDNSVVSTRR
jgi:1,4-alpha-glucan branching enzyme